MIWMDLKYAFRSWRRSPGLAIAIVFLIALTGALCICAFSVTDALLWRSLPYADPGQLIMVWRAVPAGVDVGSDVLPWSPAEYAQLADNVPAFQSTAAAKPTAVTLTGRGTPKRLDAAWVTPQLFSVLGVTPYLGRWFGTEAASSTGDAQSVILGYDLWRTEFHGDPHIVGTGVTIDGKQYNVIGIAAQTFGFPRAVEMPKSFHAAGKTELWLMQPINRKQLGNAEFSVVGRLRSGVSRTAAIASLELLSGQEDRLFPQAKGWHHSSTVLLAEAVHGPLRKPLALLIVAVLSALAISLCNLTGLILSKQVTRRGDFALQVALGADRRQLLRASLIDGLVLALVGGLLGIVLAVATLTLIRNMASAQIPLLAQIEANWRVVAFSVLFFVFVGCVLGLFSILSPALSAPSSLLRGGLRNGNDTSTARLRSIITIVEISLSISLMAGAAMVGRTVKNILEQYPGFSTDSVLTAQVNLPRSQYSTPAASAQFYRSLIAQMSQVPSVTAAAIGESLPLKGDPEGTVFQVGNQVAAHPTEMPTADYSVISPLYFQALGAELVKGRVFTDEDTLTTEPVAIVNTAMVKRYWPDGDILGKQLSIPAGAGLKMTIVGQVADMKHRSLTEASVPEMFVPFTQKVWTPLQDMQVVIKYKGSPEFLISQLRNTVGSLDSQVPVSKIETLQLLKQDSVQEIQLILAILSAFAVASILIAAAGVNAVILENVRIRRREFAIRMALGSSRRGILAVAIRQASVIVPAGLLLGLLGSYVTFRTIAHFVPRTIGLGFMWAVIVALVGLGVSGVAAAWPCFLALRVEPAKVLREA
jgi:predicted permease